MQKRKRGRPQHEAGTAHTDRVCVRISEQERNNLQQYCKDNNISQGAVIRNRISDIIHPEKKQEE